MFPHREECDKKCAKNKEQSEKDSKLEEINVQIKNVWKLCQSKGMSEDEIESVILKNFNEPIFGVKKPWKKLLKLIKTIIIMTMILFGIVNIDPLYRRVFMYGRLMLFQVCSFEIIFNKLYNCLQKDIREE